MSKQKAVDWMRYLPVGVLAVSFISSFAFLQAKVTEASNRIDKMEVIQNKLSEDSGEVRISQARTEEKINSMVELLKDIKDLKNK